MNSLRDVGRDCPVLQTIKQYCEFIAPQTRNGVRGAQAATDSSRDGNQELIAGVVTQTIVNALESIEVDKENCE